MATGIIVFILVLLVLVLVHEFGHFIVAKKFGIRVDEFGFGFPPKLFGKKFGETEYTFNLLPIGGFVRIFGENPDDESITGPDAERSFVNKPKYVQAAVLFAGVFLNWVLAWFLMSSIYMMGIPHLAESEVPAGGRLSETELTIFAVSPDTPAWEAGLRGNESIVSLSAGEDTLVDSGQYTRGEEYITDFRAFVQTHAEEGFDLSYTKLGSEEVVTARIVPVEGISEDRLAIGVAIDYIGELTMSPPFALWQGLLHTVDLTSLMFFGFIDFFSDMFVGTADFTEVSGPVGIAGLVSDATASGLVSLMFLTAIISINLAILNLLPFPALDGGRLLFLLIEVIKGSPIRPQVANALNMIGFALLILLMLVVTYNDILKI